MTEAVPNHYWLIFSRSWTWVAVACFLWTCGCASLPYRYSQFHSPADDRSQEIAFQYGRPQKTLDNIAWFTGIWSRVLTLNSNVNKHELSEKTKDKLVAYLEENDLTDVLVRVNQYDPKGEWRRLRENELVSPGWRYSFGALSMVKYVLIPGRVFGGDEYNPFTNTLYINSDVSAIALHEAAFAKDIHSRTLPGTYAVVNEVPIISLWRHTNGVNDVLGYAQSNHDWLVERETYRVVYPQMGVRSAGGLTGPFLPFWDGILISVAGATAGHVTGRIAISQRKNQLELESDDLLADGRLDKDSQQANHAENTASSETIQVTNHEMESADDDKQ